MAVTGDFHRLQLLKDRLRRMGQGEARKELLHDLTNETHRQILDSFIQKRDTYGKTWAPRKPPAVWAAMAFGLFQQNHPLLDKSGDLINSVRALAVGVGIKVTMLWYAVFHVQPDRPGTVIPQRTPLPTARQGLGPIWTNAFLRVSAAVAKRFGML